MVSDRSSREMMIVARFALVILTIGALIGPLPAHAQLVGGVFGSRARDSFGGTNGLGAVAGVSLPLLPLEVFATGTLFYPACSDCVLKGWSLGVKFSVFPLPVIKPYLTFGRAWRNIQDPSVGLTADNQGLFGGAGLEIRLPGFGIFAEGRYEFMMEEVDPDLRQWILRAGLMMRWGGLPL